MSENLDLVRSILAAWVRGDFSSTEWAHPEIDYEIVGGPEPGNWSGLAGMAKGARGIVDAWEGFRAEVEEYRELENDRIVVFVRVSGRGKASGLELGSMWRAGLFLFDVHDGKVTRHVFYWDRNRALADLGLEE